ncbi:MAG: hypothetical protein JO163_07460 [Methylobacteriaceae bacterium]|nr:hypothetical protein [Methylobacteriaceae bacterium]MBV9702547.1 hypothetical protein [Methylobacteriaceae bacterium]
MSESKLLRALADKIDELEAVKLFPTEVTDPGTVTVAWSAGNDHPGYPALNDAIGALVKQHWNALRSQVIKQRESEVQSARSAWSAFPQTTEPPVQPAAPASETVFRKISSQPQGAEKAAHRERHASTG